MRRTDIDDDGAKILAGTSAPSSGPPLGQPLKSGKLSMELYRGDRVSFRRSILRFVSAEIDSLAADLNSSAPLPVSEPHPFPRGRFHAPGRNGVHAVLGGCGLSKILRAVIEEVAIFVINDPYVSERQPFSERKNDAVNKQMFVSHLYAQPPIRMRAPGQVPGEFVIPGLSRSSVAKMIAWSYPPTDLTARHVKLEAL